MRRKALTILMAVTLIFSMTTLSVMAAENTQDGVLANQKTDKSVYESEDNITTTLKVTNQNDVAISNVQLTNKTPKGYHIVSGETKQRTFDSVGAGESVTLATTFASDKASDGPATGDSGNRVIMCSIICLACAIAIVLIVRSKKARKSMLMVLIFCFVAGTSAMTFGDDVFAATSQPSSMDITTTVTVDGTKLPVDSTVSYEKGVTPAPTIKTVEDVLATVEDFPTSNNGMFVPDNAWTAVNGNKCYQTNSDLCFSLTTTIGLNSIGLSNNVVKSGNDYIYSEEGGRTVTFHMTGDALTSITFTNESSIFDGTYAPESECIAAGTMISMPGGTQKAVEELEIGDIICTFDHESGEVSSAPVCFIWESKNVANAFTLTFENDIDVTVIEEHGFYDQEEQKYVFINSQNAEEYIGHHFYNADTGSGLELKSCKKMDGTVDAYAIITSGDLNHMSNGMLSMCDGSVKMLANIFEYDNQMKFDEEKKKADIDKYGLMPKEKILELEGFIESDYDDYNLQYLNVAIGKGLTTWERIKTFSDYCVANGL